MPTTSTVSEEATHGSSAPLHDEEAAPNAREKQAASEKRTAEYREAEKSLLRDSTTWTRLAPLAPFIMGLVCARVGLIGVTYGSYTHTDLGIFTDGPMILVVSIMLVVLIAIARTNRTFSQKAVRRLAGVSFTVEALAGGAFGALVLVSPELFMFQFAFSFLCTAAGSLSIMFWLRLMRGTNSVVASFYVLTALIVSEILLMLLAFLPAFAGNAIASILTLAQFPCLAAARTMPAPQTISGRNSRDDFFGFGKDVVNRNRFMIAFAVGIGTLSIVIGLLRGYPNGDPIPFTPVTRIAYMLVVIGLALFTLARVMLHKNHADNVDAFITMQALAAIALVCYAMFPQNLAIGAVFTTTMNAFMVAFTWYIIIAFMTVGKLDPYYYSFAGWVVWLGCRSLVRTASIVILPDGDAAVIIAVTAAFLAFSTQLVFRLLLDVSQRVARSDFKHEIERIEQNEQKRNTTVEKVFGLHESPASMADVREETMRRSAEEMGKQFMLSDREIEVLTLYALGHTQKRVAEELYISQGTAHAHIKRIYAKTNLHSRQELIDYLQKYTA